MTIEQPQNDESAAGGQSRSTAGLGGFEPAAWMYKNAYTRNWYLQWTEAKDRLSVPLYTPEQIAEIVASEHRHQKLLEENCRILRQEISELEASSMSEEALDILRRENDRLRTAIRRALDDSESGNGWGPDVTVCQYLRDALKTPNASCASFVSKRL